MKLHVTKQESFIMGNIETKVQIGKFQRQKNDLIANQEIRIHKNIPNKNTVNVDGSVSTCKICDFLFSKGTKCLHSHKSVTENKDRGDEESVTLFSDTMTQFIGET